MSTYNVLRMVLGDRDFIYIYIMTQLVNHLPAMWETRVRSLGWEELLEKRKHYPLQYSGLENSMDSIVHGGHKELDTTE